MVWRAAQVSEHIHRSCGAFLSALEKEVLKLPALAGRDSVFLASQLCLEILAAFVTKALVAFLFASRRRIR